MRSLPDCNFADAFVDLPVDGVPVNAWPEDAKAPAMVLWRVQPPTLLSEGGPPAFGSWDWRVAPESAFFKVLRGACMAAGDFRRIHAVYDHLARVREEVVADPARDPPPASLVDARLLYGAGEVCVLMPWVPGRDSAPADLDTGGCAVAPIARAIVWLARHRLLYVDVRGPNVRVGAVPVVAPGGLGAAAAPPPPSVTLVDYDDMVLLPQAPASADELCSLLAENGAAFVGGDGAPGARPALVAALVAEWGRLREE